MLKSNFMCFFATNNQTVLSRIHLKVEFSEQNLIISVERRKINSVQSPLWPLWMIFQLNVMCGEYEIYIEFVALMSFLIFDSYFAQKEGDSHARWWIIYVF